ncbi:MAG TPA: SCO family protein [Gemmataceae bacterium]|jgi:protein SCO1/2|nr:SCO family protein [Gemmataceae bacterium]
MLVLGLLAAALLGGTQADADTSRLAVIKKAPDFALTTHEGETMRLADLKGKVVLVSFIFTTCNGTCPATTSRMERVQEALKAGGLSKDGRVQLLSITLDPQRDTPRALRAYIELYEVDPANWTFLTGSQEEVKKTLAAWGMWAKPAANGQLDHPSRIFLVDPKGRIREVYSLNFFKPAWVVEDVELLLKERR